MISVAQAEQLDYLLREQGRPWVPGSGDRFVIPGRDIDTVFVIAEMTIEVEELSSGRLIRFNGTTEWALDSIAADEVLWIPREDQLRELLGERFLSLARTEVGLRVTLIDGEQYDDREVEVAYVKALLA